MINTKNKEQMTHVAEMMQVLNLTDSINYLRRCFGEKNKNVEIKKRDAMILEEEVLFIMEIDAKLSSYGISAVYACFRVELSSKEIKELYKKAGVEDQDSIRFPILLAALFGGVPEETMDDFFAQFHGLRRRYDIITDEGIGYPGVSE